MATARGANTRLLAKQEVTYGANPGGSDWRQFPFIPPLDLGGAQNLLESPVIGISPGRDPSDPFYDAVTVDGTINLPLDLIDVGFWFKMLFGAPVTSGSTNYTHTFKSGTAAALPSFTAEVGYPDVPSYVLMTGCKAGSLAISAAPTGRPQMTLTVLAQDSARSGSSVDSTPVLPANYEQFNNFQGTISREGVALGYVTAVTFNFNNNLEAIRDIGSGNNIKEAIEQDIRVGVTLGVRFSETTLVTDSEGTTPVELSLIFAINANKSVEFIAPRVFLPKRKAVVQGRAGVDISFEGFAAYDTTAECAMQVVLKNQVASY